MPVGGPVATNVCVRVCVCVCVYVCVCARVLYAREVRESALAITVRVVEEALIKAEAAVLVDHPRVEGTEQQRRGEPTQDAP